MKYKVGDKVLIKSKYDPGCDGRNYPFNFIEGMLNEFGGKIMTISDMDKFPTNLNVLVNENLKLKPEDFYRICLAEDIDKYSWSSAMFNPYSEEL